MKIKDFSEESKGMARFNYNFPMPEFFGPLDSPKCFLEPTAFGIDSLIKTHYFDYSPFQIQITASVREWPLRHDLRPLSSASLISRYILRLAQRGCCCFCAACPNRKMYLEIRGADEVLFSISKWTNIQVCRL